MLFSSWLRNRKSSLERRAELRRTRRAGAASRTGSRLFLEKLEDRCLLSAQIFNYNPTIPPEYAVPSANSLPDAITPGPDGNVWFTEDNTTNIGQITPSGVVNQILDPGGINDVVPGGFGRYIIKGPNGDLWFSANSEVNNPPNPEAIEMTTTGDVVQTVALPPGTLPNFAVGPHNNLWFTEYRNDEIGYIAPDGHVQPFTINFPAYDIISDNAGGFWIDSSGASGPGQSNMLAHITPNSTDTAITENDYCYPGHGIFRGLALDSNGNLWVGEPGASFFYGQGTGQIDKIEPSTGKMTGSFLTPTPNSQPYSLVAGPDGAVWFTEGNANQIGRITPDGIITEYPALTPNSGIGGITLGPDGNLWFTEESANQIGEVVLYPQQTYSTPPLTQTAIPGISQNFNLGSCTDSGATGTVTVDWGDPPGDTTTLTNVPLTGPLGILAHTYANQGVYTVTETITNTSDPTDTATTQFQVVVGPVVINTNNSGPGSLTEAIQEADEYPSLTNNGTTQAHITFNIPTTDPGYHAPAASVGITSVSVSANVATLTTSDPVPFTVGQTVTVAGLSNSFLNGDYQVTAVTANSFSYALVNVDLAPTADSGTASDPSYFTIYTTGLPTITAPVLLDGYSQPGSSPNTHPMGGSDPSDNAVRSIVLDGGTLPITGANSTIRGLVIQNGGIDITGSGASGNVIEGNYIDGANTAVYIDGASNNTIGGTVAGGRNIIAASSKGIFIGGSASTNVVEGNYIGVDASGEAVSSGLGSLGVVLGAGNGNIIGGTTPCARNVISGWRLFQVALDGLGIIIPGAGTTVQGNYIGTDATGTMSFVSDPADSITEGIVGWANAVITNNLVSGLGTGIDTAGDGETIQGNYIGTDWTGTQPLPNGVGVYTGTSNDLIGGTTPGAGNIIAFNDGDAVAVGGTGDAIEGNSIHDNTGLGIDLNDGVPILNDSQGHSGPNNFQDFPVLNSPTATTSSTSTFVSGTFREADEPNTTLTLDFYANTSPDPNQDPNGVSGYGQGQIYLGSRTVYTDGSGNVSFTADLALGTLASPWITATATVTDPNSSYNGDTSEFALDVQASSAPSQTFTQNLPGSLPQSTAGANTMTIQADPTTINDVVSGLSTINLGASVAPVSVYLNLAPGTYQSQTIQVPQGMTLYINGQQGTTIDPASPALTVVSGTVIVSHVTLVTTGNAPTLLVTGGNVTLLNDDIIQSSTIYTQPTIAVTGGTVNLGTASAPGNNTLSVSSSGDLVCNTSGNPISAVGDTFVVGGTVETAPSLSFSSLASNTASAIPGQTVTFSARVAPDMPNSATPTGSVDFYDTSTSTDLGKVTLSGGVATLNTSALALGTHVIQASYSGDSNYLPSLASVTQTVITSIFVLDPTAGGALTLSGNAAITIPGTLLVDSNSKTALSESGNASIKAGSIQVVGGVSKSGNATLSPAASTGVNAVPDPLASLAVPVASTLGLTSQGAVSLSGNSSKTISPGIYSQITVSGNASLTLKPGGVYILAGGGLTVSGNASISGSGVVIFNAGSAYNPTTGSDGGTYGSITLSGNGTYSLSAPTTGTYAGILIFQDRGNTHALTLSGNATVGTTSGTIYAKAAALTFSGNAQTGNQQEAISFVVDTMTLSGNSTANGLGAAPAGTIAYTPAQIRSAYGISSLSLDGTGQTIAIVDAYDDPDIYQALDTFDGQFGLTSTGPTLYQQYGPASSFLTVLNQQGQATGLPTTDPAGAGNPNWEMEEALDVEWAHAIAPGAKIVLVEANSQALSDLMAGVATAANQPGVSVVSMSWGFAEGVDVTSSEEALYDSTFSAPGVTFVASTGDYGAADPEYPAFSPNVVAVGGTSLTLNVNNSYNSEIGWGYYSNAVGAFIGSGGGISLYEAEPAFQQGAQSTGYRTTPDVSFVADPATGAWIADPYNLPSSNPFEVVGGTSLSAPAWSGLLALVNQGRVAAGEKTLNSASATEAQQDLYSLSQADYNVIASGSNGYSAAAGYNLVTGLGTPVANLLVPDLIAGNFPATGRVAAAGAAQLVNSSGSDSVNGSPLNVFDALTAGPAVGELVSTLATAVSGNSAASVQGMSATSSTSVPSSGSPMSAADQMLAELAGLLSYARNAYQSELSSVSALWQSGDALALQRLDALLSMEAGAMGVTKDTLMRDLFFASMNSPTGV